jgi:hypothetical protein
MSLIKRKRLFVDASVQGAFFLRIVFYWFSGLFAFSLLVLSLDALQEPGRPFLDQVRVSFLLGRYAPEVIASLFILPLVLYDTLVLTNRFTGPVYRLRRAMRELAAGEHVAPLKFRKADFWQDLAQEFNAIAERQQELEKRLASEVAPQTPENRAESQLENTAV